MKMEALCKEVQHQKYIDILSNEKLPATEAECEQKGIYFNELEYLVNNLEDFISSFRNCSKSRVISSLCEIIVLFGLVHKFEGEDRDFSAEDFPHTAEQAKKVCHCLKILIKEFNHLERSHRHHFIINILLLCATHNKKYFWSNDDTINLSREILSILLECTKHEALFALLCDDNFHPTIFKGILKKMRPFLMKDTWMLNPSSCYMFFWFLCNVKHPCLADYIQDVFPPPFMFVSYYGIPQRVLGIQCFSHLLDNVPPTLMMLDGKEDAIYHTLYPLIYSKEIDVVQVIFPCVLKLPMMQVQKKNPVSWCEYDKVFYQLLFATEMENNLKLKRVSLTQVLSFTEHNPPFKHLKRLMNVVKSTLSECITVDKECQTTALKILRAIIKSCWPRMEYHCLKILTLICELFDTEEPPAPSEEIYNLCEECVILLRYACPEKFQAVSKNYIIDGSNMPGVDMLRTALTKS